MLYNPQTLREVIRWSKRDQIIVLIAVILLPGGVFELLVAAIIMCFFLFLRRKHIRAFRIIAPTIFQRWAYLLLAEIIISFAFCLLLKWVPENKEEILIAYIVLILCTTIFNYFLLGRLPDIKIRAQYIGPDLPESQVIRDGRSKMGLPPLDKYAPNSKKKNGKKKITRRK
ncbi:hypothetical protein GV64_12370 [Endozoicomonas elysicola]|uniref:Uncharacterized protein n=1 Tax=Endozoicomonas elysicola TaxID=305900 RepID=A0A081KBA2_9GAMM|nr:hypothetical protein GV64_12370 [Endozoicomonas elysicola]